MKKRSVIDILNNGILNENDTMVCGWVKTRRDSKIGISFLNLYDGSCLHSIQIVVKSDICNYKNEILKITSGCSISVIGKLILSPKNKQKFEIQAKKIQVLGWVKNPEKYPISAKNHSLEYLREVAHLRPRTNVIGAVTRIRHTLAQSLQNFLNKNGYFWVSTPIITSSNTEGAGDMFRVSTIKSNQRQKNINTNYDQDFFDKEVFLTVSGQLNAEMYASALSKIYTFGPVFRAENSNTSRHLAEFWMLEPEMAYADLNDVCNFAELLLKDAFEKVLDTCFDDILFFSENFYKNIITRLKKSIENPFVQIEYSDAIIILMESKKKFKDAVYWGIDFSSEHERFLTEKYFQAPVIIKNYPKKIKAFYMRVNQDNKTVASMDLLVPGVGEILGGSQREERLNILDKNLEEKKLNKKDYWWYRDLRKYGTVKHAGFGLGFERLILYVTGMKNIRDVIAFPRTPNHINF